MKPIRYLVLIVILLGCATTIAAQGVCKRNLEPDGGFSTCVPEGWTAKVQEGQKYRLLFAPQAERFTANINVQNESAEGPLDEYVTLNIENIIANYQQVGATDVKALSRSAFKSETGLAGVRASFHAEYKGLQILTIQYYFSGKAAQKLVLNCAVLEEDQVRFEPICDRVARSLRLEDQSDPPKPE